MATSNFDFPILMYHALWPGPEVPGAFAALARDPQLRDPGARRYAIDQRRFDAHMRSIANSGMSVPRSWSDLDDIPPPRPCWITFDDGHRSNHELALPVLLKRGLCAMFFITTDWTGRDGFMTEDQLREMHREGMLLGTHGCSHRYFDDLSEAELARELRDSKDKLETIIGDKICALALPGGRYHPALPRLAPQLGYTHLFTSRMALAGPDSDPLSWPRIAITEGLPEDFVSRLAAGDAKAVRRMARSATVRAAAKRLLGNNLYDRLRGMLLSDKADV